MEFRPASPASVFVFLVVVLGVIAAFLFAVHRAYQPRRRPVLLVALTLGAGLGALAALVASGRLAALPYGGLPMFFGGVLLASTLVALSPLGGALARATPLAALVGFQAFRLPLELVLHDWVDQGTIPGTMSWTGQNWDIIAGTVALLAAPWANRRRGLAWGVNLVGVLLLLNVMRVAVLSSPLPFAWGQQPPLLLAWHLPYALIGPVCVGGAWCGHLVLTRRLLQRL